MTPNTPFGQNAQLSLGDEPAPVKSDGDEEVANSGEHVCPCEERPGGWSHECPFSSHRWYARKQDEVSSATDEASGLTQPVARCESGMGSERSRSEDQTREPRGRDAGAGRQEQQPTSTVSGDQNGGGGTPATTDRPRPTYRERREARAERLRGWAEKREQSAGAVLASHEVYRGDHAFNFQPGHIPERARVIRQDHRAHESLSKAASMNSRADEVERQAEHAVYSDDPDAVERLQERVAKMTADRDRFKAYNASCRKGSPDSSLLTEKEQASLLTTARVTPYAMGKGGGFPSYVLTNLSANLNRQKKRLVALERSAP